MPYGLWAPKRWLHSPPGQCGSTGLWSHIGGGTESTTWESHQFAPRDLSPVDVPPPSGFADTAQLGNFVSSASRGAGAASPASPGCLSVAETGELV